MTRKPWRRVLAILVILSTVVSCSPSPAPASTVSPCGSWIEKHSKCILQDIRLNARLSTIVMLTTYEDLASLTLYIRQEEGTTGPVRVAYYRLRNLGITDLPENGSSVEFDTDRVMDSYSTLHVRLKEKDRRYMIGSSGKYDPPYDLSGCMFHNPWDIRPDCNGNIWPYILGKSLDQEKTLWLEADEGNIGMVIWLMRGKMSDDYSFIEDWAHVEVLERVDTPNMAEMGEEITIFNPEEFLTVKIRNCGGLLDVIATRG